MCYLIVPHYQRNDFFFFSIHLIVWPYWPCFNLVEWRENFLAFTSQISIMNSCKEVYFQSRDREGNREGERCCGGDKSGLRKHNPNFSCNRWGNWVPWLLCYLFIYFISGIYRGDIGLKNHTGFKCSPQQSIICTLPHVPITLSNVSLHPPSSPLCPARGF